MNNGFYKGILHKGKKKHPITLAEVVAVYRHLMQMHKASCEIVAGQLTRMGYVGKKGSPVNRHQVFRALSNSDDGVKLLEETRGRIGR